MQPHKRDTLPISELKPAPYNPRTISKQAMDALSFSLQRFGIVQEVVVNKRTGHIVGGHQRVEALKKSGVEDVPVVFVDLNDAEERELNVALNSPLLAGEYDVAALESIISELNLTLPDDVAELRLAELVEGMLDDIDATDSASDDEAPDVREGEPDSKVGEVYQLGPHRLVCGDSMDTANIALALQGQKADLLLTDPPYNLQEHNGTIGYGQATKGKVKEKKADWDVGFSIDKFRAAVEPHLADNLTAYVFTSQYLIGDLVQWMRSWGGISHFCLWSKPNPMPSLQKRSWTWDAEIVAFGTRGKHTFHFPDEGHAPSTWHFTKTAHKHKHPTEKPVDVIIHPMRHSSNEGDLVLDPFGGSGTTLIAAAKLKRRAALVELSPKFCDVIRRRWTKFATENNLDVGTGGLV